MQITKNNISPTKVELAITADQEFLDKVKDHVLGDFAKNMSLSGFRKGHAPKNLVEKNADPSALQSQFLDHAVNDLYAQALVDEKLRPAAQPEVNITKFVPFSTLEFKATVEVVGKITLPDYKAIRMTKKVEPTTEKDIDAVIEDLRNRDGAKQDVTRAAKEGDEVVIDFKGVDAKTKTAIANADGSDYPIVIGSGSFIPGFEPELIGLKPGEEKIFTITFPKDYGAEELQNKKVEFTVTVKTIQKVTLPKLDDSFAGKVGPFRTLKELRADVEKQLKVEKDNQAQRNLENDLLAEVAENTKADIPKVLIDEEIDRIEEEEKRNLIYRGQTWQEHLTAENKTAEQHHEGLREGAEARVKTGLALGEIAEAEGISYTQEELDSRITALKSQYNDKQMRSELDKPDNRRELGARLVTEKTIAKMVEYASAK